MTDRFSIGKKQVGGDAPVFMIAELSANHGGSIDIALRTIEAAAAAGADAIKLQTYTPDTLTLKSDAPPFVVKTKNEWAGRTLHDLYAEAMTPWEWHRQLVDAAHDHGLECFSTPFDATATQFLEELGVPAYKIASFEIGDLPLVESVASLGKPMIISTGMASLADIEAAVTACRAVGNEQVALLRCVSAYPADPSSMDLRSFATLSQLAPVVGLSDHTRDATVAIASVALGAKLIEKHFILDRSVGGPDAFFSLEPKDFKAMVDAVRATEAALGKPRFGPTAQEMASTAFRRSLFVASALRAGEVITCDHVRSVRPAHGMSPAHLPFVLGRRAAVDVAEATPLSWEHVGAAPEEVALTLRGATLDDGPDLLEWRNDPSTRKMSRVQEGVAAGEHATWLASTLTDPSRRLLIAELAGSKVGQLRLDLHGRTAEVSITVKASARGQSLGVVMLRRAEAAARQLGVARLVAEIRTDNAASIRVFKRAGYYGFVRIGDGMLRAERSLRDSKP